MWRSSVTRSLRPRARLSTLVPSVRNAGTWSAMEEKWQQRWTNAAKVSNTGTKEPYYCLAMFPYPSGQLHIGHVRVYTISDSLSRLKRMQGYDVLHPMGWDAFGLPAENAAIERGISPAGWTERNIEKAKEQLQSLGIAVDWDREVATCDADYYKWTQWLFLKMLDEGLAYRKEALVNWDPVDKTVLANEQVDAEGKSWRSGALVEQKSLDQWFFKITQYGDRLLNDLDKLGRWPDAVKRMQSSWIGRSKGSKVQFQLLSDRKADTPDLTVFTTRVDTLFGASFLSVAPDCSLVDDLLLHMPSSHVQGARAYILEVKDKSEEERSNANTSSGVFTGLYASHPLTDDQLPIYLAEYVLGNYGTGVVMGVPAHDSRDHTFASFHHLPITSVIDPNEPTGELVTTTDGRLVDSGDFSGLSCVEAQEEINAQLEKQQVGGQFTQFRLRDWLVSRQRYWGAPVPVIHCPSCGPVGVPTEDLPVALPELSEDVAEDLRGGDGQSPLARMHEWRKCKCPKCGGDSERDTDTLDTFVDSSWYFLRYCDARNPNEIFSKESVDKWMKSSGVDMYVGGIEHAILHLLYSRFITKFLYDAGMIDSEEPFSQLLAQGMVLGRTHKAPGSLRYLHPSEYETKEDGAVIEKSSGKEAVTVWEKMSKSKRNGVDPEEIRQKYGADVTRLVVLFKAPPSHELEWSETDLSGQHRWLLRLWNLVDGCMQPKSEAEGDREAFNLFVHSTIQRVTEALDTYQSFNVAIAELMKLSNYLSEHKQLGGSNEYRQAIVALVKMLAPLAPHNASEMFEQLQQAGLTDSESSDVHESVWPTFDEELLAKAKVKVVLQVKGKPRDTIWVSPDQQSDRDGILALAMESEKVLRHVGGKEVRKAILIPPKKQGAHALLNIVT